MRRRKCVSLKYCTVMFIIKQHVILVGQFYIEGVLYNFTECTHQQLLLSGPIKQTPE